MVREEGAHVTFRSHAQQHEIERAAALRAGQLACVRRGGRVEIGRVTVHRMHARRLDRHVVQQQSPGEPVVARRVGGGDGALVDPEDVDAPPLDGGVEEGGKKRIRDRSTGKRAGERAVESHCLACFELEALPEAGGEPRARVAHDLRIHDDAVTTRRRRE
jgi:hypothetical protein